MKKVNRIHKSPRMFSLGGHILGQLLAWKPTIVLVYPLINQRGTEMVNVNQSITRERDGREKRTWSISR